MNLVLLEQGEAAGGPVRLAGRRAKHIADVHRAEAGRVLRVGVVGGPVGTATVASASPSEVVLDGLVLGDAPPAPVMGALVLALPRPLVLRRVLAAVTAFGLKKIVLVHSLRVEKSYWQSPLVGDDAIREALVEGLEQAGDTMLPEVLKRRRWRPFVEDELAGLAPGLPVLAAHPAATTPCPRDVAGGAVVVVGPEGGFVDDEVAMLEEAGARAVSLGTRPLRVEQAVSVLLGRVFPMPGLP